MPGSATLQGQTGSLPGVVFASSSCQPPSSPLLLRQQGLSLAQSALDAGRLDFDTCLALLSEVLQPAAPTYFNFGACPSIKAGTCSLYSCTEDQANLLRFINALLLRFFPDETWSSLWINFDCKKLPHRDSQNARGRVIDTNRRPCCFPASALHATMPWQGHRWLVTAYTCQHVPALSASASALLRGWGFPLPQPVAVPEKLPSSAEVGIISAAAASGPRIFVDVCCGGTRPLCMAFEALHLPVLPVDLLQDSPLDILSDDVFDGLLRLCFSGQVGLMHASPPCKEYSRLKLRPGGPKAIRSPEFLGGLPSNTPEMQSRVLSSRALLHRCVQLLECAFEGGGHCDLEQPTNAMSWMEDFVQAFLLRVHAHCISTPACRWGLDVAKSWMFASSSSLLHTLAGKCTHPANSHSSIAGVLDSFGGFASQQTAIYPAALCQAYASAYSSPLACVRPCTAPLSLAEAHAEGHLS